MSIIDVWLIPVVPGAARDAAVASLLATPDWDAVVARGFSADQDRAATARAGVRRVLAAYSRASRADVATNVGRIDVDGAAVHVSWSHSGAWVALAVARDRAVGVDIEERRTPVPVTAFAYVGVRSLEEFVALEAVAKAGGAGLAAEPRRDLRVQRLAAPCNYVAAVAAPGDDWSATVHLALTDTGA